MYVTSEVTTKEQRTLSLCELLRWLMILRMSAKEYNLQSTKVPKLKLSAKVRYFLSEYQGATDCKP